MEKEKAFTIEVKMHTGSSKKGILYKDGVFHIYTHCKPIDGKANLDALKLISDYFGIPKRGVSIVKGEKSKDKVFEIKRKVK